MKTPGNRLKRIWFNRICGSRYKFDDPHPYWHHRLRDKGAARWRITLAYWLSAIVCRFRKHVIDGREMGGGCGQYALDAWCSRCFYAWFKIVPDEAPWMKERHSQIVRMVKKGLEE